MGPHMGQGLVLADATGTVHLHRLINHLQRHQRDFCPCNVFQVSEDVDTSFAACATNCNVRTICLTKVYLVDGSWSVVEVDAILGDKLKLCVFPQSGSQAILKVQF